MINKNKNIGALLFFCGLMTIAIFAYLDNRAEEDTISVDPSSLEEFPYRKTLFGTDIYDLAMQEIERNLKSPGSAEFSPFEEIRIKAIDDTSYMVRGYVDAQNGFGALMRIGYNCMVIYSPKADKSECEIISFKQR